MIGESNLDDYTSNGRLWQLNSSRSFFRTPNLTELYTSKKAQQGCHN